MHIYIHCMHVYAFMKVQLRLTFTAHSDFTYSIRHIFYKYSLIWIAHEMHIAQYFWEWIHFQLYRSQQEFGIRARLDEVFFDKITPTWTNNAAWKHNPMQGRSRPPKLCTAGHTGTNPPIGAHCQNCDRARHSCWLPEQYALKWISLGKEHRMHVCKNKKSPYKKAQQINCLPTSYIAKLLVMGLMSPLQFLEFLFAPRLPSNGIAQNPHVLIRVKVKFSKTGCPSQIHTHDHLTKNRSV